MRLWSLPATTLSAMLGRREVSSREVVGAHLERIADVDGKIAAFTEVLRESALADAEASDARRARGEARGPLEGLPVSVKECFDVAGRATTIGLTSWRGRVARQDSAMVTALREAGAVIVGRTNLSQTMLYIESRNPIFGQTANPWSLAHSPGGSSGGEAAAIAAGMSPLGVGTDIGGSIRTPAHFCGIVGIKPSLDRLPMSGYRAVAMGQVSVRAAAGPLARTVGDLALFFRSLDPRRLSALDPAVVPLPWDPPPASVAGDRIGYFADDGVLAPSPALTRAVSRAAEALRAKGCAVVAFAPPEVPAVIGDYLRAVSADEGAELRAALAGTEADPSLALLLRVAAIPASARRALARAARALGQRSTALLLEAIGENRVTDLWRATDRLHAHRARLLAEMDRLRLDGLLCPAYATPALPHGASKGFSLASSYCILFNATQLPAGVVPVTRVRSDEASRSAGRDRLSVQAARVDAKSAGLPVGVQLVGRPWRDDRVLAWMAAVEDEVSRDPDRPRPPVAPGD